MRKHYHSLSDEARKARWHSVRNDVQKIERKRAVDRNLYSREKTERSAYFKRWLESGGREKMRLRRSERLRTDPVYRMKHTIGLQMRNAIKGKGRRTWASLVGYGAADLVAHLERQFEAWMTWANYGSAWHVDHRRPVASFSLPEQVRECWSLTNLRPLSGSENCRKGAKMILEIIPPELMMDLELDAKKLLDKVA